MALECGVFLPSAVTHRADETRRNRPSRGGRGRIKNLRVKRREHPGEKEKKESNGEYQVQKCQRHKYSHMKDGPLVPNYSSIAYS